MNKLAKILNISLIIFYFLISNSFTSNTNNLKLDNKNNFNLDDLSHYQKLSDQGANYLKQQKYKKAIRIFNKAKNIKPDSFKPYFNLATAYIYLNRPEVALEHLDLAKKFLSKDSSKEYLLYYNYGLTYYLLSNFQKSFEYYQLALKEKPDFPKAIFGLASVYQELGKYNKSFFYYLKAKRLINNKEDLSLLPQIQNNIEQLEEKITPGIIQSIKYFEKGSYYSFKNNNKKAINFFKKSIELNPSSAQTYFRLGFIYAKTKQYNKAINMFRQTINHDKYFTKAYINLGVIYGKNGQYQKALDILKQALDFDAQNQKLNYNLALIYHHLNQKEKAKKHFKKAETLVKKNKDHNLLKIIEKKNIKKEDAH